MERVRNRSDLSDRSARAMGPSPSRRGPARAALARRRRPEVLSLPPGPSHVSAKGHPWKRFPAAVAPAGSASEPPPTVPEEKCDAPGVSPRSRSQRLPGTGWPAGTGPRTARPGPPPALRGRTRTRVLPLPPRRGRLPLSPRVNRHAGGRTTMLRKGTIRRMMTRRSGTMKRGRCRRERSPGPFGGSRRRRAIGGKFVGGSGYSWLSWAR